MASLADAKLLKGMPSRDRVFSRTQRMERSSSTIHTATGSCLAIAAIAVALELGVDLYEISGSRVKRNQRQNLFGASLGRLHAKLGVVVLLVGYHHACGRLLRRFEQSANQRSERWYRVIHSSRPFAPLR